MADETETQRFDTNEPEGGAAGATRAVPPTRAKNIAGLFKNKKTRNVILMCIGALGVFAAMVALSVSSGKEAKVVPAEFKGSQASPPPSSSMTRDQVAADSPRFLELAQTVDQTGLDAARREGTSFQPAAVDAYLYQPTPVAAAASIPAAASAPPVRQAPPDPERLALLQLGNAAAARNIALWDAPRAPLMLVGLELAAPAAPDAAIATASAVASRAAPLRLLAAGFTAPLLINVPLNSAEPGTPAVGTLLTGEFKGSTLTGTFSKNGNDTLRADFTRMSVSPYGVTVAIQATSLNPDDKLKQGIATDVDKHLFVKYVLKPSAAAVAAMGQALSQPTTVVNVGTGTSVTSTPVPGSKDLSRIALGAAAQQYSQDIAAQDLQTTVAVAAGTIVGVIFTQDVNYQKAP